jgi:hypothetical protein
MPSEDISSLDTKSANKAPAEPHTPEEEEGEIKDDEEEEEETHASIQANTEPTPPPPPATVQPPATPPAKKSTTKTVVKQPKKSGLPKKRKIDQVKSEPTQEQDDVDNSTLAKRKKGYVSMEYRRLTESLAVTVCQSGLRLVPSSLMSIHSIFLQCVCSSSCDNE